MRHCKPVLLDVTAISLLMVEGLEEPCGCELKLQEVSTKIERGRA